LQLIYGDEFSPQLPIEAITKNQIKDIEVIIGTTKDEGSSILFMGVPELFSRLNPMNMTKTFATQLIRALSPNWWLGILTDLEFSAIIEYYMKGIDEDDYVSVRQSLVDLIGDSLFICPSVYLAESLSQVSVCKVFYYHFTHIKQFDNHWGEWMGSPHFDDVQYVFGYPLRYPSKYSDKERELSLNLINSWTSFARNGYVYHKGVISLISFL
jgi:carboxylesterase type B